MGLCERKQQTYMQQRCTLRPNRHSNDSRSRQARQAGRSRPGVALRAKKGWVDEPMRSPTPTHLGQLRSLGTRNQPARITAR